MFASARARASRSSETLQQHACGVFAHRRARRRAPVVVVLAAVAVLTAVVVAGLALPAAAMAAPAAPSVTWRTPFDPAGNTQVSVFGWIGEPAAIVELRIIDPVTGPVLWSWAIAVDPTGMGVYDGPIIAAPAGFPAFVSARGLIGIVPDQKLLTLDPALTTQYVDHASDVATGTAPAGATVYFETWEGAPYSTSVMADGGGTWTADVSAALDITPGLDGGIGMQDADGDVQQLGWHAYELGVKACIDVDKRGVTDWPRNATINMAFDDDNDRTNGVLWSGTVGTDASGSTFEDGMGDITSGCYVHAWDDHYSRTVYVDPAYTVDPVDPVNDIVSGGSNAGTDVEVMCYKDVSTWIPVTASAEGTWSVYYFGLEPNDSGCVAYHQGLDVIYHQWRIPSRTFTVCPQNKWIGVNDWLPNTRIDFTFDDGSPIPDTHWTMTDGSGMAWTDGFETELTDGMAVYATDGIVTKALYVDPAMTVGVVDPEAETVAGTAPDGQSVDVQLDWGGPPPPPTQHTTAGASETWTVTFGENIAPGTSGNAFFADIDGDTLARAWQVPNPRIYVNSTWDQLNAWDFPAGCDVDFDIYDDAGAHLYTKTGTADGMGNVWAGMEDGEFDILPGMDVTATASVGGITRAVHLPADFEVTDVDTVNDLISGTAPEDTLVEISWPDAGLPPGTVTDTAVGGTWSCDVGAAGYTLEPGSRGDAQFSDADGDVVALGWRVPKPVVWVNPVADRIELNGWPSGMGVDLEIRDGLPGTTTLWSGSCVVNDSGDGQIEIGDEYDIAGGAIKANDGTTLKTLVINGGLALVSFDVDGDSINGNADGPCTVEGYVSNATGEKDWTAAAAAGSPAPWQVEFLDHDLQYGEWGWAQVSDADDDATRIDLNLNRPSVAASPGRDELWLNNWIPNSQVTVYFDDDNDFNNGTSGWIYVDCDGWGNGYSGSGDGGRDALEPGTYLHAMYGAIEKTLFIDGRLEITDAHVPAQSVEVSGPPDTDMSCMVDNVGWPAPMVVGTTDFEGHWAADFDPDSFGLGSDLRATMEDADGDQVVAQFHVPNPRFEVDLTSKTVRVYDFPANADTRITLWEVGGDPGIVAYGLMTDANGNLEFDGIVGDLTPGRWITVEDMSGTLLKKIHVIVGLTATPELASSTVTGTIDTAGTLNVWVNWRYGGDIPVTPPGWSFDFGAEGVDFGPGEEGGARMTDVDGDSTMVGWRIPMPRVWADAGRDEIGMEEFLADSDIYYTVDVDGDEGTEGDQFHGFGHTDENGNLYPDSSQPGWRDFGAGSLIWADDSQTRKELIVESLTVTQPVAGATEVNGTADPGRDVFHWVDNREAGRQIAADGDGLWVADYTSEGWTIQPGDSGNAEIQDADGDCTRAGWRLRAPRIVVNPGSDWVSLEDWEPGTNVDVMVDGDGDPGTSGDILGDPTVGIDEWGNGWWDAGFDITAGLYITASDGTTTKVHQPVTLGAVVDEGSNLVYGMTTPMLQLHAWVDNVDMEPLEAFATVAGLYSFPFGPVHDIVKGDSGSVEWTDLDGDCTRADWHAPWPRIWADHGRDALGLMDFTPGETYPVLVDAGAGPPAGFDLTVDAWGNADEWDLGGMDLSPGWSLSVLDSGGSEVASMTIEHLSATGNKDSNIVSGQSTADAHIDLTVGDGSGPWAAVDAGGIFWEYDWDDFVPPIDLGPGDEGTAKIVDAKGNETRAYWRIPQPRIVVDYEHDQIWLDEWEPSWSLTVSVDDDSDTGNGTLHETGVSTDPGGFAYYGNASDLGDIVPGMYVNATDGASTKQLHVETLTVSADAATDIVSGTSRAGAQVNTWIDIPGDTWRATNTGLETWSYDYDAAGFDITKGTSGAAEVDDGDGDCTRALWYVPNPRVYADVQNQRIGVIDYPPNTDVYLKVGVAPAFDSPWGTSFTTDGNGAGEVDSYLLDDSMDVQSWWLAPGDVVTDLKQLDVKPLTALPDPYNDRLFGSAPANAQINVYGERGDGWWRGATSSPIGDWTLEFVDDPDVHILPGTWGGTSIPEPDGDETRAGWFVPVPVIEVHRNLTTNNIVGRNWKPSSTVTITISVGSTAEFTTTSDASGDWSATFAVAPGDGVSANDGFSSKDLMVRNLAITKIDWVANTITGTNDVGEFLDLTTGGSGGGHFPPNGVGTWTFTSADVPPGEWARAESTDSDGDSTVTYAEVEKTYIEVEPRLNEVVAHGFTPNSDVTLYVGLVDDAPATYDYSMTLTTDEHGEIVFRPFFDITAGQYCTVVDSAEGFKKVRHVADPTPTSVDVAGDTIGGTVDPNERVFAIFSPVVSGVYDVSTTSGGDGSYWFWTGPLGDPGTFDITAFTHVHMGSEDDDLDTCYTNWRVDEQKPTSSSDAVADYVGAARISMEATDGPDGTGVQFITWQLDDGEWVRSAECVTSTPGVHNLRFFAVDEVWNEESPHLVTFTIAAAPTPDTTPPTTSASGWDESTWYDDDVAVSLTATDGVDGVGVWDTSYKVASTGATLPYPPCVVSGEGTITLYYWSRDLMDNVETPKTATIKIDRTAPNAWDDALPIYTTDANFNIFGSDDVSGIANLAYNLDASGWVNLGARTSAPVTLIGLPLGPHLLEYVATDGAGHTKSGTAAFEVRAADSTPPTTTIHGYSAGWQSGVQHYTFTADDGAGWGVNHMHFKIGASDTTRTYPAQSCDVGEGTTTVYYWSDDLAGNAETPKSVTAQVDISGPTAWDDALPLYTGSAVFSIYGDDAVSGVKRLAYNYDGGGWVSVEDTTALTLNFSDLGHHTLQYMAVDQVSMPSSTGSVSFDILAPDVVAPSTTATGIPAGWSTTDVLVTLEATDNAGGAGVANSFYKYGSSGATQTYGTPWNVTAEGTTTLYFWSEDAATPRNVETPGGPATIRIDKTKPVTTPPALATYVGSASFALSPADAVSGVAGTSWQVDGAGGWTAGTAVTASGAGPHYVEFYSTDVAGNIEITQRFDFTITAPPVTDTTPPTTSVSGVSAGWSRIDVPVTLTATDNAGSGVAGTYFKIGSSGATQTYPPCAVVAEGTTALYYWSQDLAGNVEEAKMVAVRIDKTDPTTRYTGPELIPTGGTVTLAEQDGVSGIALTRYSIDSGAEQLYTGAISWPAGRHELTFYSVDNAGNDQTPVVVVITSGAIVPPPGGRVPTSLTIFTTAYSVTRPGSFILTGQLLPGGPLDPIVVYVRKPGKAYWSYSSLRLAWSMTGSASNWWYRYRTNFRTTPRGFYQFKAGFAGDATREPSVSPTITIRVR